MLKRLLFLLLVLSAATGAIASHFRYGNITWTRISETSTTVTIRLNVSLAWRLTAAPGAANFAISGGPTTGTVSVPLSNVTDPSGGWTNSTGSANVTLAKSASIYKIAFNSGNKIAGIANNSGGYWNVYTLVNTNAPGSSPVSTLPAIINMPVGAATATYTIPASDPDPGSTLSYRLATAVEMAGQYVSYSTPTQPSGFSVNASTGQIMFNTIGKTIGQIWNADVVVTDNDGNEIQLDFLINMVGASAPPVFDYGVTPANGSVINVIAGQTVSFPIRASDPDGGSSVGFSVSGLPSYITTSNFSPALPATGNPASTNFTWTPSSAQVGTTNILNLVATDNVGVQTTSSVTIKVVAEPAPAFISPTPAEGSIRQIQTGVLFQDTIVAQSSLGSNVSIAFATVPPGAVLSPAVPTTGANPGQTTVSWTPVPANFGVQNLSYQAVISSLPSIFATRKYSLIVNTPPAFTSTPAALTVNAGQAFSYTVTVADPDIPYGDVITIAGNPLPSWLTLTSTGNGTAVLSGTPTASDGGIFHITLAAEDIYHHGNPSAVEQSFDITVITCIAPTIVCQGDITVSAAPGSCGAVVSYPMAIATGTSPVVTYSTASGSNFAVGTTTVTVTATNACGTVNCSFKVTVTDDEKPVITAPATISVNNDAGKCGAAITLTAPAATDNCSVASVVASRSDALPLGADYPVGTTTLTWTATDIHNNSSTVTQTVTVTDTEKPVFAFSLPPVTGTQTVSIPYGQTCCWNSYVFTFSDPLPAGVVVTGIDLSYSGKDQGWGGTGDYNHLYVSGTYIGGNQYLHYTQSYNLTYTGGIPGYVYGGNNTFRMDFTGYPGWQGFFYGGTMTIHYSTASTPPPPFIKVNNDAGVCGAVVALTVPVATDNCGMLSVTNNAPALFPVGTTTVTWTATDNHNNTSTATQTITVTDNEAPVITTSGNKSVNNDAGKCGAMVAVSASAADNCGVGAPAGVRSDGLLLTDLYPVGTTTITWTVTDIHGNIATAIQTVTVTDNEAPVITTSGNKSVNNDAGKCGAMVSVSASAADNCGVGTPAGVRSDGLLLTDLYPVGTTTVTWTVTDVHGNTATAIQTVTVTDNEAPVITTSGNKSVNNDAGKCGAMVNVSASAVDNCGVGAPAGVRSDGLLLTDLYPVGTTTITWTATDIHGNTGTATQTVTVTDNEKPVVITRPVSVTLVNGVASVNASMVNNGSTDNCGISSITLVGTTLFHCADIGKQTVTLSVSDIHGNTNTADAVVTVVGEIPGCSIKSIPTSNVYTGGNPNNLYLGYGAQSTTLQVIPTGVSGNGGPNYTYTYAWSGPVTLLSSTTSASPVFTPTTAGYYTFTVVTTNNYGCTTSCVISICVTDIRVPGTNGAKVYVCHVPPGNTGNPQSLSISVNAVPAHLGNHAGDRLGSCDQKPCTALNVATSAVTSGTSMMTQEGNGTDESFSVQVSPNPSASYFTLKLHSRLETPVTLLVTDVAGRRIDVRSKIGSNSSIQIGHNYISGKYFAELIQGNTRKTIQLIKVK